MTTTANTTTTDDTYASVPEDLKRRLQWVAFRFEDDPERPDKRKKRPINPKTGGNAAVNDSDTWGSFDEAVAAIEKYGLDGIGYVFSSGDPYCGFDFDNVLTPVADMVVTESVAGEVLQHLEPYGYAEESVSGTGIHVILRGKLPRHSARKSYPSGWSAEAYDQDRFFVVTGRKRGHPSTALFDAQGVIDTAWAKLGLNQTGDEGEEAGGAYTGETEPSGLSVDEAIRKAYKAGNGDKFRALYDRGDLSGHDGDESKADYALLGMLAFWLGIDPEAIDLAFRGSKLIRPKWDEYRGTETYGQRSIGRILRAMVTEGRAFYGRNKKDSRATGQATSGADDLYTFLTIAQLRQRPIPKSIIRGILREATLVGLIGDFGTYKTSVALAKALSVTLGRPWMGHDTTQTPVLYIAGEGVGMMSRRIDAWKKYHGITDDPSDFLLLPEAVHMLETNQIDKLERTINQLPKHPGLIFIDTLARSFVGGNENTQEDMNTYIAAAGRLQARYGATVEILHHMNRQGEYRGSSALPGALDTMIEMEKTAEGVRLHCVKQKDGEPFADIYLQKIVVTLDNDPNLNDDNAPIDLDPATALVFVPVGTEPGAEEPAGVRMDPKTRRALTVLRDAVGAWLSQTEWGAVAELSKVTVSRIADRLVKDNLAEISQRGMAGPGRPKYYRITDLGRSALEQSDTPFDRTGGR